MDTNDYLVIISKTAIINGQEIIYSYNRTSADAGDMVSAISAVCWQEHASLPLRMVVMPIDIVVDPCIINQINDFI